MKLLAILCLAAVAVARAEEYSNSNAVTTVTERTFTIKGDSSPSEKYYGQSYGYSGYSAPAQTQQSSYSFETVAKAVPTVAQYSGAYQYAAAPAYQAAYQYQQAAPAYTYQAAPAYTYQAAPAYTYQAAPAYQAAYQYQAAPVVQTVQAVAPVAYQAVAAAPAAPAYQQYNYQQQAVGVRSESNYDDSYYQGVNQQVSGGETKVYKHVYAFAAPEEPATRARVSVQAPVNKRKHYKLVFIKAPSQQTVVDSDIVLPAQEEEKTLIYVLSKNQKQAQPEIRIRQQEAAKHAKPEVFFLKYKNEAEAQAIASGAISGSSSGVPANGEIISDGSVSILGQSSGSGFASRYNNAGNVNYRALPAVSQYSSGSQYVSQPAVSQYSSSSQYVSQPAVSQYSSGSQYVSQPAVTQYSVGTTGSVNPAVSQYSNSASFGVVGTAAATPAQYSSGQYSSGSFSYGRQEPASVSIKVTSEPAQQYEASTASSLAL